MWTHTTQCTLDFRERERETSEINDNNNIRGMMKHDDGRRQYNLRRDEQEYRAPPQCCSSGRMRDTRHLEDRMRQKMQEMRISAKYG